jgi:hypothetical protein
MNTQRRGKADPTVSGGCSVRSLLCGRHARPGTHRSEAPSRPARSTASSFPDCLWQIGHLDHVIILESVARRERRQLLIALCTRNYASKQNISLSDTHDRDAPRRYSDVRGRSTCGHRCIRSSMCQRCSWGESVHAPTASTTRVQLGTLHTLCSWQ